MVRSICEAIAQENLTPKKFILAFLSNQHSNLALRRGSWGTNNGWPSTLNLLQEIRKLATKRKTGRGLWRDFILQEVSFIVLLIK
jgi:hypothetical protein